MDINTRYDLFSLDITSNCNLRCPFCPNDWSNIHEHDFMTPEIFQKVIDMLPLLPSEDCFYFSCLFEPTLHPDFTNLLNMIPTEHRKKTFFTTNLSKRLSDHTISELATSEIHHINISLDTFNRPIFEKIRRGARYDIFIDNLERLTKAFSQNEKSPPLHYITVLGKYNYDEIPKLVETCATQYLSSMNEIRTFSDLPHFDKKWVDENAVSYDDYLELRKSLSPLPYKWSTFFPQLPFKWTVLYPTQTEYEKYYESISDPIKKKIYFVPPYVALRILANGIVELLNIGVDVKFDLATLENPYDFFKNILEIHWLDVARAREIQKLAEEKDSLMSTKSSPQISETSNNRFFKKIFHKLGH